MASPERFRPGRVIAVLAVIVFGLACSAAPAASGFFISGKLIIQWPVGNASATLDTKSRAEFRNTVIEAIKSEVLRHRVLERVRALHPELKEIDVVTRATQLKDSAIIEVTVSGASPRYVRMYLNALLDEFTAFYQSQAGQSGLSIAGKVIADVLSREAALKKKEEERAVFVKAHPEDFDSGPNKASYATFAAELKRLTEDYHEAVTSLEAIGKYFTPTVPAVVVMERGYLAEEAP